MSAYLDGDTHGRFERIACSCRDNHTTHSDVLIILGDAGVNYAIDGEVYELAGSSCIVIGGTHSIDKESRLLRGAAWWPDEQPNAGIQHRVERALANCG